MLLTAVILLIGFFALAGMVARVSQLSDETLQERRRSTVVEAQAAVDGLDRALARLETFPGHDYTADPMTEPDNMANFIAAADDLVDHLGILERARGFQFEKHVMDCDQITATSADVTVGFDLIRSDTFASLSIVHRAEGAGATCP